jgi:phosphatidylglycerophosphate synthase
VGRYRTGASASPETARRRAVRDACVAVSAGAAVSVAAALAVGTAYPADGWQILAAAAVGVASAALASAAVLRRRPAFTTPADRVTLGRAGLACGCAAMTTLVLLGPAPARTYWLFALSVATVLLDAVDGQVARRTGTATEEGGRLDMQVDARVLVVLSLAVAAALGWWVVLIGAMRYLYVAASWARPVLATPLPRSRFRVAVAGAQGGVLAGALAPFVPTVVATVAVAVALCLLAASFGSQIVAVRGGAVHAPRRGAR